MNTGLFIARRLVNHKDNPQASSSITRVATTGIALGLAVMIVSVAVVTGFKNEIREKVIGFGSHIQITNYDGNISYETVPIQSNQSFLPEVARIPGVRHIQVFGTKAGIIKTDTDIQGVVLKGVGADFNWKFFASNLIEGEIFEVHDSTLGNSILVSRKMAALLKLKTGDPVSMYFVQEPPRMRRFKVSGIYETSLEDFDKLFVLADIKHIQALNGWTEDQVSGFEILVSDFDNVDPIADAVFEKVGYNFTDEGQSVEVISIKEKYPQIFDWLNLQDLNVWIILTLMVLVAGFNMVSSLLILILERTNMVGILKALGATSKEIGRIFLYQATYMMAKGMFWGNLVGLSVCIVQHQFGLLRLDQASYFLTTVPIHLSLWHILLLNLGTLVITLLMMLLPSLVITRISPERTIRYD